MQQASAPDRFPNLFVSILFVVFNLEGIAPAKRGIPQIEVTFDIDANGILSVSAVDKGTGKEQKITIESKSSLSDEDIERMKTEAEKYAEEDKKVKEKVQKMYDADSFAYSIEKAIEELSDKITEEQKTAVKEKLENLRAMIQSENIDAVETAKKDLEAVWFPIAEGIYKSQAAEGGENSSNTSNMFSGGNPFAGGNFDPSNNPFAK